MKITAEDVKKVAVLARLELGAEEMEVYTGQMDAILGYVDKLDELDTEGIVPTSHAVPVENVFREDRVEPSLPVEEALANAPQRVGSFFGVPKVIE